MNRLLPPRRLTLAVAALAAAAALIAGPAVAAQAAGPEPAFAYGSSFTGPWARTQGIIIDPTMNDVIPVGRNIGFTATAGPSFGTLTALPSLNAQGMPLMTYKTNSFFFSGSDSVQYSLVDLDTGVTLDSAVIWLSVAESVTPGTGPDPYTGDPGVSPYAGGSYIASTVVGDGEITLNWTAPSAVASLRVYDGESVRVLAVGATSVTVTGLTNGRSYWFRTRDNALFNSPGMGPIVPRVAAPPVVLPPPVAPTATDPTLLPPTGSASGTFALVAALVLVAAGAVLARRPRRT